MEEEIAITKSNDHSNKKHAKKKKKVPIMIDHSYSRQQTRTAFSMFERGQQHGLVFTPSKNWSKRDLGLIHEVSCWA